MTGIMEVLREMNRDKSKIPTQMNYKKCSEELIRHNYYDKHHHIYYHGLHSYI